MSRGRPFIRRRVRARARRQLACDYGVYYRGHRMEPLWSPAGATSGNQSQMVRPEKRLKQAKSVAYSCHRLPETFHGKE